MKEKYAFHWQSYGQCGQVSIVHCLTLLGTTITNKEAHIATGIHPIAAKISGTDSKFIRRALRYYDCNPVEYKLKNSNALKQKVDELLDKHIPLIISCDSWEHWALIAGRKGKNKYYWIDSSNSEIIGYSDFDEIEDWMECEGTYYFIGAVPKDAGKVITDIPRLYKIYNKNESLILQWGYILADLLDIFESKNEASESISTKEFFTNYKDTILDTIEYLYLDTDLEEITEKLNDYQTVATMHNLVLPKSVIEKSIAYFSTLLTLAAVGIE